VSCGAILHAYTHHTMQGRHPTASRHSRGFLGGVRPTPLPPTPGRPPPMMSRVISRLSASLLQRRRRRDRPPLLLRRRWRWLPCPPSSTPPSPVLPDMGLPRAPPGSLPARRRALRGLVPCGREVSRITRGDPRGVLQLEVPPCVVKEALWVAVKEGRRPLKDTVRPLKDT